MANKTRFAIAESAISAFFKQGSKQIFSRDELKEIFDQKREVWNLPISGSADKFIDQLIKREILKRIEVLFDGYITKKERFLINISSMDDVSIFQIAGSLINKSYLSHYTAVYLHGLTTQVPKTVYITFEQSKKRNIDRDLEQQAIDNAFSKPQRRANTKGIYKDYSFIVHNGMYSNRAGVYTVNSVSITNIERTLIDITVRPGYAGGVHEVLKIYKNAISRISITKLIATLEMISFIYPYHQAIGFYLERAGYEGKKLDQLRQKEMRFDFYLTYEMEDKEYSKEWRIYYPKGI